MLGVEPADQPGVIHLPGVILVMPVVAGCQARIRGVRVRQAERGELIVFGAGSGTDGMHYRALGMNTVGIGNAAMRSADIFAHGLNERIRVEDFYKGLDHWYLVMKKLAG